MRRYSDQELERFKDLPMCCPSTGAYFGYKHTGEAIVRLLIPSDAMRCSGTTRECRASKAIVLGIERVSDGKRLEAVASYFNYRFIHRVGEMVYAKNFSPDRWDEFSPGIYHFMTKEEAVSYFGTKIKERKNCCEKREPSLLSS